MEIKPTISFNTIAEYKQNIKQVYGLMITQLHKEEEYDFVIEIVDKNVLYQLELDSIETQQLKQKLIDYEMYEVIEQYKTAMFNE